MNNKIFGIVYCSYVQGNIETPAGTETSATTENEAGKLPDGTGQESGAADTVNKRQSRV